MQINRVMSRSVFAVVFALLSLACANAGADTVVLAQQNPKSLQAAQSLLANLPDARLVKSVNAISADDIVIALGDQSLTEALPRAAEFKHLLGLYVSFRAHRAQLPLPKHLSLVYREPAPTEVARLIDHGLDQQAVGYFYQEEDPYLDALQSTPLRLTPVRVRHNVLSALPAFYKSRSPTRVFVAASADIYNSNNILLFLESLYQNRVLAISDNDILVGHGAGVAIHVSWEQAANYARDWLQQLQDGSLKHEPQGVFLPARVKLDKLLLRNLGIHWRSAP